MTACLRCAPFRICVCGRERAELLDAPAPDPDNEPEAEPLYVPGRAAAA